jgi:hypothetical protein
VFYGVFELLNAKILPKLVRYTYFVCSFRAHAILCSILEIKKMPENVLSENVLSETGSTIAKAPETFVADDA